MSPGSFRTIVKDEVEQYLRARTSSINKIISAVADKLTPLIAEEMARAALVQMGQLEPGERDQAIDAISQARQFICEGGGRKPHPDLEAWMITMLGNVRDQLAGAAGIGNRAGLNNPSTGVPS